VNRSTATLLVATAILLTPVPGCKEQPVPPEHRLLVLDGIEITLADVEPYVAYLASFMPEFGRKTMIEKVIDEHVLPVKLARRHFGPQRAEQLRLAQDLCSLATNAAELERLSEQCQHKTRGKMNRLQAKLPVSMFLFDELQTGAVSPPIELPQGWFVVAVHEFTKTAMRLDDFVDTRHVGFVTHTSGDWYQWWTAQTELLADKATFVHPDYRSAMPKWIRLPEQP